MDTETRSARPTFNLLTVVIVLCAIVFAGALIQIVGISNTDNALQPKVRMNPLVSLIGDAGIFLTAFSPVLSLSPLSKACAAARQGNSQSVVILVWVTVILAVLFSFAECMWTCGGHPTWYQGYLG